MASELRAGLRELRRLLGEVRKVDRTVGRGLTELSEGSLTMMPADREAVRIICTEIRAEIGTLGEVWALKVRPVRVEDTRHEGTLPKPFTEAYERLCLAAYVGQSSPPMSSERGMAVYGKKGIRAEGGKPGAKGSTGGNGLGSEKALAVKRAIDRKLRKIASEIESGLAGYDVSRSGMKRCTACGKVGEDDWSYCPRCGKDMGWTS